MNRFVCRVFGVYWGHIFCFYPAGDIINNLTHAEWETVEEDQGPRQHQGPSLSRSFQISVFCTFSFVFGKFGSTECFLSLLVLISINFVFGGFKFFFRHILYGIILQFSNTNTLA